jgi:antitoxin VapB
MAFSIKNDEADLLARELVAVTGESLTTAVTVSLRERLERERLRCLSQIDPIQAILDRIDAVPMLNDMTDDDIFGWDEIGLPT